MKKSFTLIELLVVIAIIAILAGLVMPSLGHARASGVRTNCMNNQKQLVTSMIMYSNSNDGMMIYQQDDSTPYSKIMVGDLTGSTAYLPKQAMVCTSAKEELNDDRTNAIGMLNATDDYYTSALKKELGRFRSKSGNSIFYVLEKIKNPTAFILFGDSFKAGTAETPWWNFVNAGTASSPLLSMVHLDSAVVAFADARVESRKGGELLNTPANIKNYFDSSFELK